MEDDYNKLFIHHCFQGRGRRQISDRYGAVVTLCEKCHTAVHHDKAYADYLHKKGQRKLMQENGRITEEFIALFGKNYLD